MNHEKAVRHRRFKLVGMILACVFAGMLCVGVFLFCIAPHLLFYFMFAWRPYRYTQSSVSPGGEYTVTVKATDARGFFGPADVLVIASAGKRREAYQTQVYNDGGHGGVHIFWLDEDTVRVVLYGTEQTDEAITITFPDGVPVWKSVQPPKPEPVPEELQERAFHSIWFSVHDGEHVFWVGLYQDSANPDATKVMVYDWYRQEFFQVFEDTAHAPDGTYCYNEDINEDGFTDFYYKRGDERIVCLWDPETERFVPDAAEVREVSIEETACTLNLDVGDGTHRFHIEITQREGTEEHGIPIQVSICPEGGGEAVQTWADVFDSDSMAWMSLTAQDVNFDGCMDFSYPYAMGNAYGGTAYLVWDTEAEQFVRDPYGLENLPMPTFDQERQIIETWQHSGAGSKTAYYRYDDGELTCIRRLTIRSDSETWTAVLIVEDYDEASGTLEEVYRAEDVPDNGVTYPSTEEFARWHDLDYHGEERETVPI